MIAIIVTVGVMLVIAIGSNSKPPSPPAVMVR